MINHNGQWFADDFILTNNRSFLYGDGVFETLKIVDAKILFFEAHYFRLMSTMRIMRMKIPMQFTMEQLEHEVLELVKKNDLSSSSRVRITVYRNQGGFYTPTDVSVSYLIQAVPLETKYYTLSKPSFEVELFKDFYVAKQLLSTLKTTSKSFHVLAAIYAQENDYDSCLLLNESKQVTEGVSGNLFLKQGNQLITPSLSEGCLNGVMRSQVLRLAKENKDLEVLEAPISPFDLQKAEELFLTNVIQGVQPITKYRKKSFGSQFALQLLDQLNQELGA